MYEFRPDWYHRSDVRSDVLSYYEALRAALGNRPGLRKYLKRCRHCGIFFFTQPANAQRGDLRCPFGCSEGHRRAAAAQRSAAYYHTEYGMQKKRKLNQKRYRKPDKADAEVPVEDLAVESMEESTGESIIEYARMVMGLVEERQISRDELLLRLEKISRQHSLGQGGRVDYGAKKSNKSPP